MIVSETLRPWLETNLLCVFQLFLVSLAFAYFAKAFGGSYMKSSITQIERRFDIPSSLTGVIDGGFEMGIISRFAGCFAFSLLWS